MALPIVKLRGALCKSKDFNLKDCLEHFSSFEATDAFHKSLTDSQSGHVNYVKNNRMKCNCYGKNHARGQCGAYGHTCKICEKNHHWESMCFSKDKSKHKHNSSTEEHKNNFRAPSSNNNTKIKVNQKSYTRL